MSGLTDEQRELLAAEPGGRPMSTDAICPECRAGKCRNCDGTAWGIEADEPTTCACEYRPKETSA